MTAFLPETTKHPGKLDWFGFATLSAALAGGEQMKWRS
jgi:hypothetical protein